MSQPCNVLILYPQFTAESFWSFGESCKLMGVQRPAAPLGLITIAAMLPESWTVRLIDCNTQAFGDDDLAWADVVFTGGMLPQQADTLRLIDACRTAGKPVVVGGPDPTSSPHIYEKADFQVLGEAESVIDEFLAAWDIGARVPASSPPRGPLWQTFMNCAKRDTSSARIAVQMIAAYAHLGPFSRKVIDAIDARLTALDEQIPAPVVADGATVAQNLA